MEILATLASTGYTDGPYFNLSEGTLPKGQGRNGGARARLIVLGQETPGWFREALKGLPQGAEVALRVVVPQAGPKLAIAVPVARTQSDLLAQVKARADALTSKRGDKRARCVEHARSLITAHAKAVMGEAIEVEPGHWLGDDGREWVLAAPSESKAYDLGYFVLECGARPDQVHWELAKYAPTPA